jgi:general secretion pathway protein E
MNSETTQETPIQKTPTIAYRFAKQHGVLIKTVMDDCALITIKPETNPVALTELRRYLDKPLRLERVSADEFNNLLTLAYETDSSATRQMVIGVEEELDLDQLIHDMPRTQDLLEGQDDAPIIRLLNALLSQAIKLKASDIHIETFEEEVVVRMRIDGTLQEALEIQRALAPLLISRVKVMAKLDIAEKRLPQDGRITLRIAGHTVDVRVSTMPSTYGERIVLRLLDKKTARLDLSLLGMYEDTLKAMRELIQIPHGIILVTGPTGSGKTTSLYAMLTELNDVSRNILTIEDPIEYDLPGIGQTQVNAKVEMTFAKGLRAILRQDPDIVMIGEIRDLETAEIAVQSSLTGHLVLSTLHTNSAIGAIARLRDMGVEPFLLASSLVGIIAQRLVRLLCKDCRKPYEATPIELERMNLAPNRKITLYGPQGCDVCKQLGYVGRKGIYELIIIDETFRTMIHDDAAEQKMLAFARKTTQSMRDYGFRRVLDGETTIEEIIRVTSD